MLISLLILLIVLPNTPVVNAVKILNTEYDIVITSGRMDSSRKDTHEWLDKHGIPFKVLLMRQTGDVRNDADIKEEIFRNQIAPNYCVDFVLDDRNRVADRWREMGIPCFQVAPGNF